MVSGTLRGRSKLTLAELLQWASKNKLGKAQSFHSLSEQSKGSYLSIKQGWSVASLTSPLTEWNCFSLIRIAFFILEPPVNLLLMEANVTLISHVNICLIFFCDLVLSWYWYILHHVFMIIVYLWARMSIKTDVQKIRPFLDSTRKRKMVCSTFHMFDMFFVSSQVRRCVEAWLFNLGGV